MDESCGELERPMIPLRAENPRRTFAVVKLLLIALNIVVFLYQISLPPRVADKLVLNFGVVPARAEQVLAATQPSTRVTGRATRTPPAARTESALVPLVTTLFTSMFLHGGVLHLLGNMLFLWVFGASVEDHLGHLLYLMFYLICGLGAGVTHILANWGSTIPSIGASGAISGVMGAYIVLFPRSKILTLVPIIIFFFTVRLPAVLILGYWFLIQFLSGFLSLGEVDQAGVAWWAHIGGFLLGAFLALGF
jgi:membrane associated rhomboid family serine protease